MANANRRFGFLNFAIFATAAAAVAAVLAVRALAHQPDLGTGTAQSALEASLERHADQRVVNPLAAFLQRWTNTTAGEQ
jgi:hypothetical protein